MCIRDSDCADAAGEPAAVAAGAGVGDLGADAVPVLRTGGQVQLSVLGLRAHAFGIAAFCGAALPELVSASNPETGKLEGTRVQLLSLIHI